MSDWQLQEAKNRFSEVIRKAAKEGPQTVTIRGKPAAVVVSAETYARLVPPRMPFAEYLLSGPEWPDDMVEAVNNRSRDTGRDIEF